MATVGGDAMLHIQDLRGGCHCRMYGEQATEQGIPQMVVINKASTKEPPPSRDLHSALIAYRCEEFESNTGFGG